MFLRFYSERKARCMLCGREGFDVAEVLNVCGGCIRISPREAMPYIEEAHRKARSMYNLPLKPPKSLKGVPCNLCFNECVMDVGERGFCGLRENVDGRLKSLTTPKSAILHAYKDPHITNCCAAWFCPATGRGYPRYSYTPRPEYGYFNYAVFFYGCNFSCLYCQNYSHKEVWFGGYVSIDGFVKEVKNDRRVSCICYFGGSPEPSLPFAINASKAVLEACKDRILRICFEWNGCGHPKLVEEAAKLALESGGNIKFDLKCFDKNLSIALSGVSNSRAYENFSMVAEKFYSQRPDTPILTATTLLVPGYVDSLEVRNIAEFISNLNDEIPYSLLLFHPDFMMNNLPTTQLKQAIDCYREARKYLKNVHIGNLHLLGLSSMREFEKLSKTP